tara:strand:- start:729 stop:1190 length:462 start_codon:yes stop_codon:yes gene_type:complete
MKYKNKLINSFIFFTILILSILNIKNPEKTKFYLFTSKIEEISLGNLITITFVSGFSFSSLLTFVSKNKYKEELGDDFINEEDFDKYNENKLSQEFESVRPPERDVRESQPTISVNYRFVDQDNNSYSSKNTKKNSKNLNEEDNDWLNYDNEW